jgi:hypothetical protein
MSAKDDKATRHTPAEQAKTLSTQDIRQVQQLKRRDREVRSHELAHKAIAGQYARGAPSYDYRIGPDGRRYAVGGEVSIDISKANDPRETLRKAEVIRRAAMAPANPSMQDRQIAMQASAMATEARHELQLQENQAETVRDETPAGREPSQRSPDPSSGSVPAVRRAMLSIYRVLSTAPEPTHPSFDQIV